MKFDRDCQLEIGSYVQAHECPYPSIRPEDHRGAGAIALGPSENEKGGYYFMNLETGKRIHRFKGTVLLFTKVVVDKVEELAERNEEDITFTCRNANVIEDKEEIMTMNLTKKITTNMNLKKKIAMNVKF